MLDIIKVHRCKQINEKILDTFKKTFMNSVKEEFKRRVRDVVGAAQEDARRLTENYSLKERF